LGHEDAEAGSLRVSRVSAFGGFIQLKAWTPRDSGPPSICHPPNTGTNELYGAGEPTIKTIATSRVAPEKPRSPAVERSCPEARAESRSGAADTTAGLVLRQLSVPARRRRPRRHPETLFERELVKTRFPRRISLIGGEELGVRAVEFLIEREDIHGPVNLCAPTPINQRELMSILRAVLRKRVGLPASKWMVEIGAALIKTDTELILKAAGLFRSVCCRLVSSSTFRIGKLQPTTSSAMEPCACLPRRTSDTTATQDSLRTQAL
jgi:hypothetical protein